MRFNIIFTVALIGLYGMVADAQSIHSDETVQSSAARTYSALWLHQFTNTPDGQLPITGLVADSAGNLYGATQFGGAYNVGSVFELTPDGNGGYTYNIIYSLTGEIEGAFPTSLAIDTKGNLYGTTILGSAEAVSYYGAVFELSKNLNGNWIVSNAYDFTGFTDGEKPEGGVVVDADGNVYGTTPSSEGGDPQGTVFELQLIDNQWFEQTLYTFNGPNGAYPWGGLVMDKQGDLYGTAKSGGTGLPAGGVVFKLHKTANGWAETTLHNFSGGANDGFGPQGNLALDAAGNIYGTTTGYPPNYGYGGVYKITKSGKITSLYAFQGGADGSGPSSGVAFDKAGNLYGTSGGGTVQNQYCQNSCGAVFELSPPVDGQTTTWTKTTLYSLDAGANGDGAIGPPVFDTAGNLYMTSPYGGESYAIAGFGTVFELKANPVATTTTITRSFPNPSRTGQVVTVSFDVSQAITDNIKPTGTVTVNASTGESCLASLPPSGKGSCELLFVSAGTRTLTATYSGDASNQGSASSQVTEITLNSTKTNIAIIGPDPSKEGHSVTVAFSVDAKDATKHTKPTGSVTVNASTGESCTGTLSQGGKGKCQLTISSVGSRTLVGTYSGDDDNQGSVSVAVTEIVN
jgi:hypothetical protein